MDPFKLLKTKKRIQPFIEVDFQPSHVVTIPPIFKLAKKFIDEKFVCGQTGLDAYNS